MRKARKLIVLAMVCVMLLGSTLAVHAANCINHSWVVYSTNPTVYKCQHCGAFKG